MLRGTHAYISLGTLSPIACEISQSLLNAKHKRPRCVSQSLGLWGQIDRRPSPGQTNSYTRVGD